MNPLTHQLLERLWDGNPTFAEIEIRLKKECQSLTTAEAAVIGRDLIRRKTALYTKLFKLAAFLASEGIAGNDGFMDFTDCVAVLPEERYRRIFSNPDALIDDPVSSDFEELYLVSEVASVFDKALLGDEADGGLLFYLVSDDSETDLGEIDSWTEYDAKVSLPHLYAKFGHLLKRSIRPVNDHSDNTVSLADFIPDYNPPKNR